MTKKTQYKRLIFLLELVNNGDYKKQNQGIKKELENLMRKEDFIIPSKDISIPEYELTSQGHKILQDHKHTEATQESTIVMSFLMGVGLLLSAVIAINQIPTDYLKYYYILFALIFSLIGVIVGIIIGIWIEKRFRL